MRHDIQRVGGILHRNWSSKHIDTCMTRTTDWLRAAAANVFNPNYDEKKFRATVK